MLTGRAAVRRRDRLRHARRGAQGQLDLTALPAGDAARRVRDAAALSRARSEEAPARHRRGAHRAGMRRRRWDAGASDSGSIADAEDPASHSCGPSLLPVRSRSGAGAAWVLKQSPAVDRPVRRLQIADARSSARRRSRNCRTDGRAVAFSHGYRRPGIRRLNSARAQSRFPAVVPCARSSGPRPRAISSAFRPEGPPVEESPAPAAPLSKSAASVESSVSGTGGADGGGLPGDRIRVFDRRQRVAGEGDQRRRRRRSDSYRVQDGPRPGSGLSRTECVA